MENIGKPCRKPGGNLVENLVESMVENLVENEVENVGESLVDFFGGFYFSPVL